MKKLIVLLSLSIAIGSYSQNTVVKQISETNSRESALSPLRFLASDELKGRSATAPEAQIAARYISELYRSFGLREFEGTSDYFQTFDMNLVKGPDKGGLTVSGKTFPMIQSLLMMQGPDQILKEPAVYVKFGSEEDLKNLDVKGKIVISDFGLSESSSEGEAVKALFTKKIPMLQQKGALAIIERKPDKGRDWKIFQDFAMQEVQAESTQGFTVLMVNDPEGFLKKMKPDSPAQLSIQNSRKRTVKARNVVGYIEGTDSRLKNEYILLSAHYDHIGEIQVSKIEEGKKDSIYNGARDNATGVAAMIAAARYFAEYAPKRSVIFTAFAAEEIGLVGSKFFVSQPPVPLKNIVFNLNSDNAAYNDTSAITVFGLGKTSADELLKNAAFSFSLKTHPEPSPEENLYYRSDNISFAQLGIPAVTYTMGITKMDEVVKKRYHQLSDEVGNMDLDYAVKFIQSYVLAAKNIADNPKQQKWTAGQPFEDVWKKLYEAK